MNRAGSIGDALGAFVAAHPLIALATAAAVVWQVSVFLNPYARCWRCRGAARYFGWVLGRTWHPCPKCNGDGHRIRPGGKNSPRLKTEHRRQR